LENADERLIETLCGDKPLAEAFKCLFENADDAICILDKNGNLVTVNRKAEELTGFKREDFIGKSFRKIIPLKSLPKAIEGFVNVMSGKEIKLELELNTAKNRTVLVEVTSRPLVIRGKTVGILGIIRDISERVLMENKLKGANQKLKMLFDTAMEGITIVDEKENLTFVNRAFADMLCYEEDELVGTSLQRFVGKEGFKEIRRQTESRKKGQVSRYEIAMFSKDGKPRLFQVSASPIWNEDGGFAGSLAIVMDVTERRRMEETLRESEERFRKIFESASDSIIYLDRSGRIININEKAVQVFGGSKEELLGKHFIKVGIFSSRDIPRLLSTFARILAGKPGYANILIRNRIGQERYLECSSSIVKIDNRFVGILVIARDVTERKKMEEVLRESEEKMRNILESSPDAITVADLNGNIVDCNQATLNMFGFTSKEELIGKSGLPLVADKDRERLMENIKKTLEQGSTRNIEYMVITKERREFPIEVSASVVRDIAGNPRYFMAIWKDITERKQMQKKLEEYSQQLEELVEKRTSQLREAQEKLIKNERLATIGQVASMVGHDLRNPLTGIAGATYYLKKKLESEADKTIMEMLTLIEKDIEHSNRIISDLLEYSREIKLELTATNPKSIVRSALSLVEVPNNIRVLDFTNDEPKITVDAEKIKRVFINIIKNAIEAMPDGGSLRIKSRKSDSSLEITITDTGVGMSKDVLEKIWTPFFTTKAKGMGLGLSICKRIVEAHNGNISVESEVGNGTSFTITVPVMPKSEGGEKAWVNVPESLSSTTTKA
jgi:two-component system, sporulation sensor kinase E